MKQPKLTLKYKNPELWEKIIKDFNTKSTTGRIAYKYNVKKSSVENAWINEFGIEKFKLRNKNLSNIICPVCGKNGSRDEIFRHIMNSKKNSEHNPFILEQDNRIRELYNILPIEELDPYILVEKYNLFCSESYVREIFRQFIDYRARMVNRRSINTIKQYKDGRRKKSSSFNNGWVATKENSPNKYISQEKIDIIINLFNSSKTQNEIAKMVGCKCDTVHKHLVEKFGQESVSKRNRQSRIDKITKLTKEIKEKLLLYFYEDIGKKEIAKKLNISVASVLIFFRKCFSEEERKKREERLHKYAIKKSLQVCGKKGTTGSIPENYCYDVLKSKLNYEVIHHDFDICPTYEIDISIPSIKIAISWDGPFHRKALFGEMALNKTIERDKIKEEILKERGWRMIVIEDNNNKYDPSFVEQKTKEIIELIDKDFSGKVII